MPIMHLIATSDTYVTQRHPGRRNWRCAVMAAGEDHSGRKKISFIMFSLQNILPPGSLITKGELRLHVVKSTSHAAAPVYGVFRVQQRWDASTLTWHNRPLYDCIPISTFGQPALGDLAIDITPLMPDWLTGARAPLGLMLGAYSGFAASTYFKASAEDAANSDTWPRLTLDYALPAVKATPAPQFVDQQHTLTLVGFGSSHVDRDVSLLGLVSVFATNAGPGAATLRLLTSPDGVNFIEDTPVYHLAANESVCMVASVFSKYLRVAATAVEASNAQINLRFQGKIG